MSDDVHRHMNEQLAATFNQCAPPDWVPPFRRGDRVEKMARPNDSKDAHAPGALATVSECIWVPPMANKEMGYPEDTVYVLVVWDDLPAYVVWVISNGIRHVERS